MQKKRILLALGAFLFLFCVLYMLTRNMEFISPYLTGEIALVSMAVSIAVYWQYEHMKILIFWAIDILKNFGLIYELAVSDFKSRYAASYLGAVWAFVQPVVTIVVYVVVFGYGFKSAPIKDFPFVLWLTAGMVPWLYFADAWGTATNSLKEYSYLVKKVVFEIKILPLVKICASLFVHIFFLGAVFVLYTVNGEMPGIYFLQIVYYMIALTVLTLGVSYATSALNVFVPDLAQVINILLQFGIWMTPIMWSPDLFGPQIEKIVKFNPMFYIVQGYRDCFYSGVMFWERPVMTIYYWGVTILLLIAGIYSFRKLEKHFADVL